MKTKLTILFSLSLLTAYLNAQETDPVYTASPAGGITNADITQWNDALLLSETTNQTLFGPLFIRTDAGVGNNDVIDYTQAALRIGYGPTYSALDRDKFSTNAQNFTIQNSNVNGGIGFRTGGSNDNRLGINSAGNIAIGKNNASSYVLEVADDMQVSGGILLSNSTDTTAGMIRWTGTNFEGYNGTEWVVLSGADLSTGDDTLYGKKFIRENGAMGDNNVVDYDQAAFRVGYGPTYSAFDRDRFSTNAQNFVFQHSNALGGIGFKTGGSNASRVSINAAGNITFGGADSGDTLVVSGTSIFNDNVDISGDLTALSLDLTNNIIVSSNGLIGSNSSPNFSVAPVLVGAGSQRVGIDPVSFAIDANNFTFMNTRSAGKIKFQTGGQSVDRLIIDETGNIGIGATHNQLKLYVANGDMGVSGGISLWNTTTEIPGLLRYNSSSSDFEGYNGSNWISLSAPDLTQGNVNFAGNVQVSGVGLLGSVTSPNWSGNVFSIASGGLNVGLDKSMMAFDGNTFSFANTNASGEIHFKTGGNDTPKMVIRADGWIGVGRNDPEYKFHVANGDIGVGGGVRLWNTSVATPGMVRWSGSDFEGYDGSNWVSLTSSSGGGGSNSISGQFSVDHTGNTIGSVASPDFTKSWIYLEDSPLSQTLGIDPNQLAADVSGSFAFMNSNASGNFSFLTGGQNTKRLVIAADGNVGIGTDAPGEVLDVAGNVTVDGYMTHPGNFGPFTFKSNAGFEFRIHDQVKVKIDQSGSGSVSFKVPAVFDSTANFTKTTIFDQAVTISDSITIDNGPFNTIGANSSADFSKSWLYFKHAGADDELGFDPNQMTASSDWFEFQNAKATGGFLFKVGSNDTSSLAVASDGNIGLGTNTPSYILDVVGDMRAQGGIILENTTTAVAGMVRWSGIDFEGYDGTNWISLTSGGGGEGGTNGTDGATWITGAVGPNDANGKNGDLYLNTATGDYYIKSSGTWGSIAGNLVGPTGATGPQGPAGANGAAGSDGLDGATWTTGALVPDDANGSDGDLYLNTAIGDYYIKSSGTWGSIAGNLVGPTGATGPQGPAGANGAAGSDGVDGATWITGAVVPDNTNGSDGDLYLNTATGDYYIKSSGVWGSIAGNLVGLTGATGPQGPTGATGPAGADGASGADGVDGVNGATWTTGAVVPDDANGSDGDLYLNTATGDYYIKSSGVWGSIAGNLVGPTGATGPQGPAGASPFDLSGSDAVYTAGNVGIGTNTPDVPLNVVGETKLEGNVTISGNLTISGSFTKTRRGDVFMGQFGNAGDQVPGQ